MAKKNRKMHKSGTKSDSLKRCEKWNAKNKANQSEAEPTEIVEETLSIVNAEEKPKKKCNKPKSKMAGVKSTFITENNYIMTSFGRGNDVRIENVIDMSAGTVEKKQEEPVFTAEIEAVNSDTNRGNIIHIKGHKGIETDIYAPLTPSDTLMHSKKRLEELVFGESFNDNIHIQLIYNILDINKYLSFVSGNIVYMLNNLSRQNADNDAVGTTYIYRDFENLDENENNREDFEKFKNAISPYMNYMSNVFYYKTVEEQEEVASTSDNSDTVNDKAKTDNNKKTKTIYEARDDRDIYNILRFASVVRQCSFHNMFATDNYRNPRYNIFNISENASLSDIFEEDGLLDRMFSMKIDEINGKFMNDVKKQAAILFDIFGTKDEVGMVPEAEKEEIIRQWYRFNVLQEGRNLYFSITGLREKLVPKIESISNIKDNRINKIRSKLYRLIDFAVYIFYSKNTELCNSLVDKLTAKGIDVAADTAVNDIKEARRQAKGDIYEDEAVRIANKDEVFAELWEQIDTISAFTADTFKNAPTENIEENWLNETMLNSDVHIFSKMIYMLTLMLNGEEINVLLNALIHQFESIEGFMTLMEKIGVRRTYTQGFEIFDDSAQIAKEIRIIKSFARMNKDNIIKLKKENYEDAYCLLGIKPIKNKEEQKYSETAKFIRNNVFKSKRYLYLVRYSNPQKLRELSKNKKVVEFVLSKLSEKQLRKYNYRVKGAKEDTLTQLIERFTGMVVDFEYRGTPNEKAVLTLYFHVLYLIAKNLVNINSRYAIAWSSLERDSWLHNKRSYGTELTEYFIENRWINRKLSEKVNNSVTSGRYGDNSRKDALYLEYKNTILHLNAIADAAKYSTDIKDGIDQGYRERKIHSYFELYHYIIQKRMAEKVTESGEGNTFCRDMLSQAVLDGFASLNEYKKYSKNLLKILNTPFAYCHSRYNALSIEDLFDKYELEEKQEKAEKKS